MLFRHLLKCSHSCYSDIKVILYPNFMFCTLSIGYHLKIKNKGIYRKHLFILGHLYCVHMPSLKALHYSIYTFICSILFEHCIWWCVCVHVVYAHMCADKCTPCRGQRGTSGVLYCALSCFLRPGISLELELMPFFS